MKKEDIQKKIIKYGFIGLLIIGILTIIANYIITSEPFISVAKDSYWIGYYGSILSGLISGTITFVGVWFTINYYKEKDEIENKLNMKRERLKVRPYLAIEIINIQMVNSEADIKAYFHSDSDTVETKKKSMYLRVKNIGVGPALEVKIDPRNHNGFSIRYSSVNILEKESILMYFEYSDKISLEWMNIGIMFRDIYNNLYEADSKLFINPDKDELISVDIVQKVIGLKNHQ